MLFRSGFWSFFGPVSSRIGMNEDSIAELQLSMPVEVEKIVGISGNVCGDLNIIPPGEHDYKRFTITGTFSYCNDPMSGVSSIINLSAVPSDSTSSEGVYITSMSDPFRHINGNTLRIIIDLFDRYGNRLDPSKYAPTYKEYQSLLSIEWEGIY